MTDGLSEAYETKQWDVFCENNDLSLENDQLKAENAKLRELVAYMHRCYVKGHDWGFYGAPEKEHVEATMRELGVEV